MRIAQHALTLLNSAANDHREHCPDAGLLSLTPREGEVLHYVARGLPNKVIAQTLGIAEKTVKNHLAAIFAKLGVVDRMQAALFVVGGAGGARA